MLNRSLVIQGLLVIAVLTVGMLGIDMILPSIADIAQVLHADQASMQQTVSFFLAGMGISLLISGPVSDYVGRKPLVMYGLIWSVCINVLMPSVHNVNVFLLLRFLQGLGAGAASGLCRVMIADRVQGKNLAMMGSIVTLVSTLTLMWAPTLGGYLQSSFGWSMNFYLLAGLQLMVCLLFGYFGTESNVHKKGRLLGCSTLFQGYVDFFKGNHRPFLHYCMISGLLFSMPMIFATLSPYIFLEQMNLTPIAYGWVMFFVGFGSILGRCIMSIALRRFQVDEMIQLGIVMLILVVFVLFDVVMTLPSAIYLMVGILMVMRLCQPFIGPGVMSKALSPFASERGLAGSLYGSIQQLVAFIICGLVGLFHSGGLLLASSYCFIALMCFVLFRKSQSLLVVKSG